MRVRIKALLCISTLHAASLLSAQTGITPPTPPCNGTIGYLVPVSAVRHNEANKCWQLNPGFDFTREAAGMAFLVAPDLLLSAGSNIGADFLKLHADLLWIPADAGYLCIPENNIYPVAEVISRDYTGVRGIDANYALLRLSRVAPKPIFTVKVGLETLQQPLWCCLGERQNIDISVLSDEGVRSFFIKEQFPVYASGSPIPDAAGLVHGILIPGPQAGVFSEDQYANRLYGNAVQRISQLPAKLKQLLIARNLEHAIRIGNAAAKVYWGRLGAQMDAPGIASCLMAAAETGTDDLLDSAVSWACRLQGFNSTFRTKGLWPLLITKQKTPVAERLMDCALLDLNEQDSGGRSPLHLAVSLRNQVMASSLLQHGASVHILDKSGETALFEAVRNADITLCSLLMQQGANPDVQNLHGETAAGIAKKIKNRELKHLLHKARKGR